MKKQILHFIVVSMLTASPVALADTARTNNSIKVAATVKTAFDIISYPAVGLPIWAVGFKTLTPLFTYNDLFGAADGEFIGKLIAGGAGLCLGVLGSMTVGELYLRAHKMYGFSDAEIDAISRESSEQKFWILAQAAGIGWTILNILVMRNAAREEEKRKEEQNKRPIFLLV